MRKLHINIPADRSILKLIFLFFIAINAHAQQTKIPPFRMIQSDNRIFKAEQLPFGKPIAIIYFEPDCEHCQRLTENMLKSIKKFSKTSVVMITYYPREEVEKFSKKYGLYKYPNFYLGTEGSSFFLKNYYNLSKLPFMAIYTKNGDIVKKYYSEKDFSGFLQQIQKLSK